MIASPIALPHPRAKSAAGFRSGQLLARALPSLYLSLMVLLPIAALLSSSLAGGWEGIRSALTSPGVASALQLTLIASAMAVAVNVVMGTAIAWVLVRDDFPGKFVLNGVVDLPFALPTVVAGITLLVVYGPQSPLKLDLTGGRMAIVLALLFVTLPFVTRAVQPVLQALDSDMEEAAAMLGAGKLTVFRRVIVPTLAPALASGMGLAFARALGEFGSVTILASNLPNRGQVMSLLIFSDLSVGDTRDASVLSVVLLTLSLLALITFTIIGNRLRPREA